MKRAISVHQVVGMFGIRVSRSVTPTSMPACDNNVVACPR